MVTVNSNGTWSINVPVGDLLSQNTIVAEAKVDDNGTPVQSEPATSTPITEGAITVDVDTTGKITGTTVQVLSGTTVQIVVVGQDKNGNQIEKIITTTVDTNGEYSIDVPSEFVDGNVKVTATTTDSNNHPVNANDSEPNLDRVSGSITVDVTPNGNITGTTTDVPSGSNITLTIVGKDSNGNPITDIVTVKVAEDGSYTTTVPNNIVDGSVVVTGTATDRNGTSLNGADNEPELDRVSGQIIVDVNSTGTITGTTKDVPTGSVVTLVITDKNGNPVGTTFAIIAVDGTYTTQVPTSIVDGNIIVTGTTVDRNGHTVTDNDLSALDRVPGSINVDVTPNGTITGTTTDVPPNSTVTLTITGKDSSGNPITDTIKVTTDNNGNFTTTVPSTIADGGVVVTGTTTDRNNQPLTGTDSEPSLDRVTGSITVDVTPNGTITGTTTDVPPNSTVTLTITGKDSSGNPITDTIKVTTDNNGNFTTTVPSTIADGGVVVTGTTTDRNNQPLTGTDTQPDLDRVTGSITVDVTPNGTITGTTTDVPPNSTVTLTITGKDTNGNPITDTIKVTTDSNGNFTTTVPATFADGGVDVRGTTTDRNNQPLTGTDTQPDLDRVTGSITVDVTPNGIITGTTTDVPPNSTVTLTITGKDTSGNPITETITVPTDSNGNFTTTVPLTIADGGVVVTVTTTDRNNKPLTGTDSEPALDRVAEIVTSISNATANEGKDLVHTVTLSSTTTAATEFSFKLGATGDTASTADYGVPSFSNGVTYDATTGKITVPVGISNFTVTYGAVTDTLTESTETLTLNIGGVIATGTITDVTPTTNPLPDEAQAVVVSVTESADSLTKYPGLSGVSINPVTGVITSTSEVLTDVAANVVSSSGNLQGKSGTGEIFVVDFDAIMAAGSDPTSFNDIKLNSITGNRGDSAPDWIYIDDVSDVWKVANTNKVNNPTSGYNNFDNFVLQSSNGTNLSFNSNGVQGVIFKDGTVFTYDSTGTPSFNTTYDVDLNASLILGTASSKNLTSITVSSDYFKSVTQSVTEWGWTHDVTVAKAATVSLAGKVLTPNADGSYTITFDPTKTDVNFDLSITMDRDSMTYWETQNPGYSFSDLLNKSLSSNVIVGTVVDSSSFVASSSNVIFDLLVDNDTGGNALITDSDFVVQSGGSTIDVSKLLPSTLTSADASNYLTVNYDANAKTATLAIDRDSSGTAYHSANLLILTNQSTSVSLADLLNNNQIII